MKKLLLHLCIIIIIFFYSCLSYEPHIIQVPYQKDQIGIVQYPIASLRSKKYNIKKRQSAFELIKEVCPEYDLIKEYISRTPSGAYTSTTPSGNLNTTYYNIPYGYIEFKCK